MNWYHQNRWLGNFLIAFAAALLIEIVFLFHTKGAFDDAVTKFNVAAAERSRLLHLTPFPNDENVSKTQLELENYRMRLTALKAEIGAQVLPQTPIAPNEFQARFREAIVNTTERARANRVKLPEDFHLGFDEFVTSLPNTADASLLGQELRQVELLIGILVDAKVDALTALKRGSLSSAMPAAAAAPRASPTIVAKPVVERAIVEVTFTASPSALRKVLNQIASSDRQFFIVRTLYVRNEHLKGPVREQAAAPAAAATTSPAALKFIVGNEHVEAAARVELVRFAF